MKAPDIIAIFIITAVLLATCYLSQGRGFEANFYDVKIASLEKQIADLRPIPRINVERAAIYPLSGEVVVDTVK